MPKELTIQTTIYNTILLDKDIQPKIQTSIFMGQNTDEGFVSEISFQELLNELEEFYQEDIDKALGGLEKMKQMIEQKSHKMLHNKN